MKVSIDVLVDEKRLRHLTSTRIEDGGWYERGEPSIKKGKKCRDIYGTLRRKLRDLRTLELQYESRFPLKIVKELAKWTQLRTLKFATKEISKECIPELAKLSFLGALSLNFLKKPPQECLDIFSECVSANLKKFEFRVEWFASPDELTGDEEEAARAYGEKLAAEIERRTDLECAMLKTLPESEYDDDEDGSDDIDYHYSDRYTCYVVLGMRFEIEKDVTGATK